MARNFYYGADARIVSGSANFASLIAADPGAFNILPALAAEYVAADAVLQAAYTRAVEPTTRTPVAVAQKDLALKDVQRRASALARIAYGSSATDAQLVALGLQPRPIRGQTRRPPPDPPMVHVTSVVGRLVMLDISSTTPGGGRKPDACVGVQLYTYVGDEPPADSRLYHFEGIATRRAHTIRFANDVPNGATAWVSAAWVTRRGTTGRACSPVQITIQGGPVLAKAA